MSVMSSATQSTTPLAVQSGTRTTGLSQPYVYFVPLNGALSPTDYEAGLALDWLTDDEVAKVSRYRSVSARNNGLQVRLGLRAVLSLHSELKPNEWRFSYGAKGKPALTPDLLAKTGLHFNLSHSGEWLMIGIVMGGHALKADHYADADLCFGVDIERERSSTDIVPILNHYFTQAETDTLLQLPPSLQRQRFFDLWAVKESYIKARGLGLALSLKSFSVDFGLITQGNVNVQLADKSHKTIELQQDVKLNFTEAEDIATTMAWQTVLGRLDQQYRFAITFGLTKQVNEQHSLRIEPIDNSLNIYQLSLAELLC
ncbi:4'-phosphopantetheinyl transferase family protein [Shewanella sp. SG41-4]|uniref:4'-phosphopantetheinyl transferase family protein n=1 Tax=Shewanella sp. SG41-4 TaxID=2760976 RepID=UPI00217609F6|nr:4'-phosphopantetheinyl transferase superfamily protein [Shewanella sp. SG41-4]